MKKPISKKLRQELKRINASGWKLEPESIGPIERPNIGPLKSSVAVDPKKGNASSEK